MLHNSISNQDQSIKLNNLNMYMSLQTNNNTQQIITYMCRSGMPSFYTKKLYKLPPPTWSC